MMHFKVFVLFIFCVFLTGCQVAEKTTPVSGSSIDAAIQQSGFDVNDRLAVMPQWYRSRCQPSWWKSVENQDSGIPYVLYERRKIESASPWVSPTPLWRIMAICAVFMPFLIAIALKTFDAKCQDEILFTREVLNELQIFWKGIWLSVGIAILVMAIPFVLCCPIDWLFRLLAYGFTGDWYYLPWHFVAFCFYGFLLLCCFIATIAPLLELLKSGKLITISLGLLGLLLEAASLTFTIRDIIQLAYGNWH